MVMSAGRSRFASGSMPSTRIPCPAPPARAVPHAVDLRNAAMPWKPLAFAMVLLLLLGLGRGGRGGLHAHAVRLRLGLGEGLPRLLRGGLALRPGPADLVEVLLGALLLVEHRLGERIG